MLEEFHAKRDSNNEITAYQQKYGWNSINANVWMPSLSELVGYNPNTYNATNGCYYSAMQGLNTFSYWHVDVQGGAQFAYFKQFNTSGGGQKIWDACNQQVTWLRSSVLAYADRANSFNSAGGVGHTLATASRAVHPVVDASSISRRSKLHIVRFPLKDKGKAYSLRCSSSPQKGTFAAAMPL